MDNGIILLIFWVVINLFLKSSKDKKKAEEAKRKRANESGFDMKTQPSTKSSNKPKSIIDAFREEIEKEIQREKDLQQKQQQPMSKPSPKAPKPSARPVSSPMQPSPAINEATTTSMTTVDKNGIGDLNELVEERMEVINTRTLSQASKGKILGLNLKRDVLKGIIYSEIISQPKSLRNLKDIKNIKKSSYF
ncbi:hypothetical protein E9840_04850 [Tissierella creatinini]|nr:hypothetical protein E9840_04850 [Tissierella creatinini]TJX67170.1 hypothetical protein E8P77_06080 [Soehngenia saccharolytica]